MDGRNDHDVCGNEGVGVSKGTKRCSGHCCRVFTMMHSPDDLRRLYSQWIASGEHGDDISLVYPMLDYLGQHTYEGPMADMFHPEHYAGHETAPQHYYRCKRYDAESGNCTIYENRPRMCRNFPETSSCPYKACTWKPKGGCV